MLGIVTGWTTSQSSIDWNRTRFSSSSYYTQFQSQFFSARYPSEFFLEVPVLDMLEANEPIYFERNLRNMIAVSEQAGSDVMLLTFAASTESSHFKASSDEYIFGRNQHNDVTQELAEENGTYFLDLAEIFPEDIKYFTDGIHMTVEGNTLRAQLIGEYLIENVLDIAEIN